MEWYNVTSKHESDKMPNLDGHVRAPDPLTALKTASGLFPHDWPVEKEGRTAARARDPKNPGNFIAAAKVKDPVRKRRRKS